MKPRELRFFLFSFALCSLLLSPGLCLAQTYQLTGFRQSPQSIVAPLQINDEGFALELYSIIQRINDIDQLKGTPKEISLLLWVSLEDQALIPLTPEDSSQTFTSAQVIQGLKKDLRKKFSLQPSAEIPFLKILQTKGSSHFAFFQDLFEVFLPPSNQQKSFLLPLAPDDGDAGGTSIFAGLKEALAMDTSKLPLQLEDDDDGGNLEVTPEGIPYVGSTTSSQLRKKIKELTGKDPLVLSTDWLYVGHVDEMLAFLPTKGSCGSQLVYADPLEAINFLREFKKTPLIPRQDLDDSGATIRNPVKYSESFFNSLQYFTKPSAIHKKALSLDDFDLSKPIRDLKAIPRQIDVEFLGNLNAHRQIQKAVSLLQKTRPAVCNENRTGLPTLFYSAKGVSFDEELWPEEAVNGYSAVGSYLNLVSLRQHVIIAKERTRGQFLTDEDGLGTIEKSDQGFFGPIVRKRLANILGGDQYVHQIDAGYYEKSSAIGVGSTHCLTNVIRSSELWTDSKEK